MGIDEWSAITRKDTLGNAYNIIMDEVGYISSTGSSEGYCLNPFGLAFHYS